MNTRERNEQIKEELTHMMKLEMAWKILKILDIPHNDKALNSSVPAIELVDILMNEEKLKVLVSKLHNKAFW